MHPSQRVLLPSLRTLVSHAASIASQIEFVPASIAKVAGSDANEAWAYLVEYERRPGAEPTWAQASWASEICMLLCRLGSV